MSSPRKRKVAAEAGGTPPKKRAGAKASGKAGCKARGRLCSVAGCTKQVQQGGVCCRHGAKTTRASCSHGGCANFAKRGGLCRRHGAFALATCAREGCRRCAKRGRYCDGHAAERGEGGAKAGKCERVEGRPDPVSVEEADCGKHVAAALRIPDLSLIPSAEPFHNRCANPAAEVLQIPDPSSAQSAKAFNNEHASPTVEGETFEDHGQFNFLCDYYEDMYEPFPV